MKTIRQKHFISASPEEVFTAITNLFTIELWSGYPAQMEASDGTEFSIFEGNITGKNIKITENKQVIQEWYFGDRQEESIVTIDLSPYQTGTRVTLEQTNVPDDELENLDEGWRIYYWGAINKFFK